LVLIENSERDSSFYYQRIRKKLPLAMAGSVGSCAKHAGIWKKLLGRVLTLVC
jgi:hypothetical protein